LERENSGGRKGLGLTEAGTFLFVVKRHGNMHGSASEAVGYASLAEMEKGLGASEAFTNGEVFSEKENHPLSSHDDVR